MICTVINCGSKVVEFDLTPGIYTEGTTLARGKTYTRKLLDAAVALGRKDILTITYRDTVVAGVDTFVQRIKDNNYSVIFADRADLYITRELFDAMSNSGAIVYLDCKLNGRDDSLIGDDCCIEFNKLHMRYYVDTEC